MKHILLLGQKNKIFVFADPRSLNTLDECVQTKLFSDRVTELVVFFVFLIYLFFLYLICIYSPSLSNELLETFVL